jgi:hypothetical protein
MQLVFPDDEAVQPHLKLLAMAKRWKKGQDDVPAPTTAATTTTTTAAATAANTSTENTTTADDDDDDDDDVPLPESRVDDEEMNDES